MPTLAIFNPEHDLCLANGSPSYMPPRSALEFARSSAQMMQYLFDDVCVATDTEGAAKAYQTLLDLGTDEAEIKVEAWGWDSVVKRSLLKQGISEKTLPTDREIEQIRRLSNRATCKGVQNDVVQIFSLSDLEQRLKDSKPRVLKAPWSGAGWGLRWISTELTDNERNWILKTIVQQGSVMLEPRYKVVQDFAVEYFADGRGHLLYKGMSLFETQNGVYRGNMLLTDDEIVQRLSQWVGKDEVEKYEGIEQYILSVAQGYKGPVGVDMFVYQDDDGAYHVDHCVEINFRYTMGMVASAYLKKHPEMHGTIFTRIEN